jgi:Ca-activated chloride channel homolog
MKTYPKLSALALLSTLVLASGARAQGFILPRPSPPVPSPRPLAIKSQKVTMQMTDGALKVEVEQVFQNPNSVAMEGTYLFPLPSGATVSTFRMMIDKEPVEGKILAVEEARRIYESYVRRNVDPAILEYVGRNAFQARVFPIPAGGERRIYLGYSQVPEFNAGIYQAVYPLNSERVTGQSAGDVTIDCTVRSSKAIKTVYSPTHEIQVKRESDHLARATFEGKDVRANRDFILYYTISDKAFGLNALSHRKMAGEPGHLMLMLAPRHEVTSSDILPKDLVFVVDTSGSMQGAKFEQAQKALQTVVGALNEQDRFNIIRFSSEVTNFRPSVVEATTENRAAARTFVNEMKAVGGTAIDDALQAGLASLPKPEDRQGRTPFLVFMTDGLPTIGVTDIDRILQNAGKAAAADVRLFSFGVGTDVNTLLLDRLARDHRGAADYVSANEDVEAKIGGFYAKISDPVLSNVQVSLSGAKLTDVHPAKLPDLFAGTQLLVLGRYEGHGKATVTLTGDINGKPQKYAYDVTLPERESGHDFIPKLWASRKIGFLLEEIRLKGDSKELKDEVIRLSKEHGIVTPYTAYLVEEPGLQPVPLGVRAENSGLRDLDVRFFEQGAQNRSRGAGAAGRPAVVGSPSGPAEAGKPVSAESLARLPKINGAVRVGAREDPAAAPVEKRRIALQQQARQQADGYGRSTGSNAVEASRRVRSLKDKEVAETELEVSRTIQGRAFRWTEGVWRDETATGRVKVVPVRYGSEAYFRLVAARADWARFLSAGRSVVFRTGKSTVVAVGEKGKEKLTDAEVKLLEK